MDRAKENVDLSSKMLEQGFYAGAVTSAIDSIVKTSVSVDLIGANEAQITDKAESAEKSAESALSEVGSSPPYCLQPTLSTPKTWTMTWRT